MKLLLLTMLTVTSVFSLKAQVTPSGPNELLVVKWFEAYNKLDSASLYSLFATDFASERNGKVETKGGPALQLERMKKSFAQSPGRVTEILALTSSQQHVIARVLIKGTLPGGSPWQTTGIVWFIIENNKIQREYQSVDDLSYVLQAGYRILPKENGR